MKLTRKAIALALEMPAVSAAIAVMLLVASCERNDEHLIPCNIRVDDVELVSNPSIQHLEGSLSHQITDVWIYVEDASKQEFIGVYELPVTFPVLKEGVFTLRIKPGIKINGIAETRGEYPFYDSYDVQFDFIRDTVLDAHPRFMYADFCEFVWSEDFEDAVVSMKKSSRSDTSVMITASDGEVFEGEYSGKISLDAERFFFESFSSETFDLPGQGTEVFLEMNFMTNTEVTVGLMVNFLTESTLAPVVILNETNEWKKIYVSLKNVVSTYTTAISFNVFLAATKPGDMLESRILIDNLKLIHK
ncbi:MAG: hypothetical protein PHD25_01430 [Bacteroidales bacterium]|nr:hypothetical protein [Bacteroidales bacterium]